jgi:purine-nucleoside phosphorylase
MSPAFTQFREAVRALEPRAAVVLGSGLGDMGCHFRERAALPFFEVPGLFPTTVGGHAGRLAIGEWAGAPTLVFFGRLHFYEGHSWNAVTAQVRLAAELGAKIVILTNAAGGIHPGLDPGCLMAIRGHLAIVDRDAWKNRKVRTPYSERLLIKLQASRLHAGTYAALTGPCYETPAEIRALAALGADAVGMSTAKEAEAAAELGLEVAAISCITNRAAGLEAAPLAHADVLLNAKRAVERLGEIIETAIS